MPGSLSANSSLVTTVDGEGARIAGPDAAHAFAYNAWSDVLTTAFYLPVVLVLSGKAVGPEFVRDPLRSVFGGLAAFSGYAVVVWALTQVIGAVAALRECSVVFAAIIGVAFLGEPFRGARASAALLILGGVIALRLA
jgi:uncharacterized membrane protein